MRSGLASVWESSLRRLERAIRVAHYIRLRVFVRELPARLRIMHKLCFPLICLCLRALLLCGRVGVCPTWRVWSTCYLANKLALPCPVLSYTALGCSMAMAKSCDMNGLIDDLVKNWRSFEPWA